MTERVMQYPYNVLVRHLSISNLPWHKTFSETVKIVVKYKYEVSNIKIILIS